MERMTGMKIEMTPTFYSHKLGRDLFLLLTLDPPYRKEVPPHARGLN
jgi:hypothetical protein